MTVRRSVVLLSAFVLPLGIACEAFEPADLVARHGMTHSGYQKEFNKRVSEGLRLTHVSGYNVAGSPRFAAIWEEKEGPGWVARHGLSSAQYQAEFDEWVALGYRPTVVDGYEDGGQARYAVIFEQDTGGRWVARHGMTSSQYQAEFDHWTSRGYRPTWVQGYGVGGAAYYTAIWELGAGPAWIARHGMTSAQYQSNFDDFVGDGYRLTHVSSYEVNGTDYYAAIWGKTSGPPWAARHRMTSRGYQHEFMDRYLRGYRLEQVDGTALSNAGRYAALWHAEPSSSQGDYCEAGQCFSMQALADGLEAKFDGNVVKWGFELRRGRTVVKRAGGPARTSFTPPARDFTVDDRFNPASVSKSVTAVAMIKLMGEHGVSLDAPVYSYLPRHWNIPPNNRTITFKEVLNHSSGLRGSGFSLSYDGLRDLMETEIDLTDKVGEYENINYALARLLVASLDGFSDWTTNPGPDTSTHFIGYVNRAIFEPLGIYDVAYKPTGSAPVLFYPAPPGTSAGTTYGDWSLRPGSAGGHNSVHELAMFVDATFNGVLLSDAAIQDIKDFGLGFSNKGSQPDGSECWSKGGFFPGGNGMNGGAELSTLLVFCDNGLSAMVAVNGFVASGKSFYDALDGAFTASP